MSIELDRKRVYTFPIENPVQGDDVPRHKMPHAFTVERIVVLKIGGTGTFDWELRYSPNGNDQGAGTLIRAAAGENNETTGNEYLPPSFPSGDPTIIPADDWIWLELTAVSTGIARPVALTVIVYGVEKGS